MFAINTNGDALNKPLGLRVGGISDMSTNDDTATKGYWKMNDDKYYTIYRMHQLFGICFQSFLGFIGGIVMWLALRDEDPRKAKKGLILRISLSVVWSVGSILIFTAIIALVPPTTITTTTNPSIQYPST